VRKTKRKHLHAQSVFEAEAPATFSGIGKTDLSALKNDDAPVEHKLVNKSVTLTNGQTFEFATISSSWSAEVMAQMNKLSAEQKSQMQQHTQNLAQAAQAEAVQPTVAAGQLPDSMKQPLASAMLVARASGMTQDDQSQAMVTGGAILDIEGQMSTLMNNVSGRAQYGTEIKAEVSELQDMVNNWPDDGSTQKFSYQDMAINGDGSATMNSHNNVTLSKSDAQNLLSRLSSQAQSADSMTTAESFKMQVLVQQDQQAVSVLSQILFITNQSMNDIIKNIKD